MQTFNGEQKQTYELVTHVVRAAQDLSDELRKTRRLFDFDYQRLVDKVAKSLENPEFDRAGELTNLEMLQDLVTVELLQEVVGVTTTLEEVYSDPGQVEYAILSETVFTERGDQLKRLDDILVQFRTLRAELAVRRKVDGLIGNHP